MILGRRYTKLFLNKNSNTISKLSGNENDISIIQNKYNFEYLVKYKNLSYLHVQWLTVHEIGKKKN